MEASRLRRKSSYRSYCALSAAQIADLDSQITVVALPLGATEQHGPHLPMGTDSFIAEALTEAAFAHLSPDASIFRLPTLEISNSVEHSDKPGSLSFGRGLSLDLIIETGRSLIRAGLRKLVILNAHGGNVGVMTDAAHALRAELGILCVYTNWSRFGLPPGALSETDRRLDIHGGKIETSIMMAACPDLVDQEKVENFANAQATLGSEYQHLRAYGPVGFGWMGTDLNPSGAVGDASAASAELGMEIIEHQAKGAAALLTEVSQFQPNWFEEPA